MKIKEWTLGQSDLETLDQQKERLTKERDRCRQSGEVSEGIVLYNPDRDNVRVVAG